MSKPNDYDTYIIPPNFIEGGTFFGGLLKLRNTAEALVIVLAIGIPVFSVSALTLTAKIIILCLTALPLGIIALVGINGESLSSFIFLVLKYLHNRRVITRNEEEQGKRKKRKKRKAKGGDTAPKYINPVAEYLPVEKIENGIIYTRDHRYLKIVEVVPINFLLRSAREQRNIRKHSGVILGKLDNQVVCIPENSRLNGNIAVFGASGSMKTRAYCINRILQSASEAHNGHKESLIITDPKSELYEKTSEYLRSKGYVVRVFNLIQPENSDSWNCLAEIEGDELMAQIFCDIIIKNTGSEKGDHFWNAAEMNLLKALVLYVALGYPPESRNIGEVYKLLVLNAEKELDNLFSMLPASHPARAPYALFSQSSDTVRSGVIIGLGSRLQVFQNRPICQITSHDEIDMELPGKQPCAYFCITSDQDSTFDFLTSLFLSFAFIKLIRYADKNCADRRLPVPVHVMAGLFADGQVKSYGAAHVHIVLAPALGHVGQRVGVHSGLDLRVHHLRAADAGGVDTLIAQSVQHHGGILQNFSLLVQIGEGVDAAVGEDHHLAIGGDLIEHAVGGEMAGAQAMLLVEHGAHQIGGAQDALHQEISLTLCAQGHGLGGAVGVAVTGDDLIIGRILAQTGQHVIDLVHMAHQNGGGDALLAGLHHRLDDGLVVCGGHGDDAGLTALGGL